MTQARSTYRHCSGRASSDLFRPQDHLYACPSWGRRRAPGHNQPAINGAAVFAVIYCQASDFIELKPTKSTMEHQHQGNSVYSSPKPKIPARGDPVVQEHQGNPVHSYFSPKHKIPAGGDPVTAPTSVSFRLICNFVDTREPSNLLHLLSPLPFLQRTMCSPAEEARSTATAEMYDCAPLSTR